MRLQLNGAVSEVNKKFISHLTRAKRTLSAAETVQVSHALPAVRFSCLLRGSGVSSKMAPQQEKAFCVLRFEVSRSVITVQRAVQCSAVHGSEKTHHSVCVPPLPMSLSELLDQIMHALQTITADMLH